MTLHALDVLSASFRATWEYRPRGRGQWLWVTAVALFVGGTGIGIPTGGNTGGTGGELTPEQRQDLAGGVPGETAAIITILVAVLFVLWLLVVVLGSLLEFPFLVWLRDGEVDTWSEVRAHLGQGLSLAAFRVLIRALGLALAAGVLVAIVGTDGAPLDYVIAAGNLAILFGLIGFPVGVVMAFTTAFVVPTMMVEDAGVVGGWRRFWLPLADAPKQFVVYAVAVAVLAAVGGILVVLSALVASIPGLLVGGIFGVVAAAAVSPLAGIVVAAAVAALVFTAVALAGYALLKIFLRYYGLFVLARVDVDLDYLPERRRAVGAGGPDSEAGESRTDEAGATGETPPRDPGRDDPRFVPAVVRRHRHRARRRRRVETTPS
ncbi:hypothetical protein BRD11_01035 [Halobacteriales archaeon SW_12_69_24]|nr:MAG: hypothetical protein BRD11_01035 [Halobacteriales archaeon SW_12_69_24]